MADVPVYSRILLKLSGEALMGSQSFGIDEAIVVAVASEIAEVHRLGVQVAVVIGGGNIIRGVAASHRGLDRVTGDYMGMLGTVMNCLALQDFLEQVGVPTRVQTAITMGQVAEPYIPLRAIRHLEKGRVVIFGAGAGMPFFSTDTVSAQRALETHCDRLLIAKSGVDGIYTADPKSVPTATKIEALTFDEALAQGLRILDAAAFALCQENKLSMLVFGMEGDGNITAALRGERIGTLVTAE
jgi:uridylate kinase